MKRNQRAVTMSMLGVLCVAVSVAYGANVVRTCAGGSACPGTTTCDSTVAWCCCKPLAGGVYTCTCSTSASCDLKSSPVGMTCIDP